MSADEPPTPWDFFDLGLRVAWHLCGCESRPDIDEARFSRASRVVDEILRGSLILHNSPADLHKGLGDLVKWLQQQGDETSKRLLQRIEQEGIERVFPPEEAERCCRRDIAKDQVLAKQLVKSFLTELDVPREWAKHFGLEEFLK